MSLSLNPCCVRRRHGWMGGFVKQWTSGRGEPFGVMVQGMAFLCICQVYSLWMRTRSRN